jgi:hypothetical protein
MDLRKDELSKVLVVDVSFDTDPNSLHFRQDVIDAIIDTAKTTLEQNYARTRGDHGR